MICFVMEACKGGTSKLQTTLNFNADILYSAFSLLISITQIMHGMQDQYSRVPMPSSVVHYTENRRGQETTSKRRQVSHLSYTTQEYSD
jgi:hypothetical protein